MNTMFRSCLCVVLPICGWSSAWAEVKPSQARTEYDRFLQPYGDKAPLGRYFVVQPKGTFKGDEVPLKLIVTAVEGDEGKRGELWVELSPSKYRHFDLSARTVSNSDSFLGPCRRSEADPGVRGFAGGTEGREVTGMLIGCQRWSRSQFCC